MCGSLKPPAAPELTAVRSPPCERPGVVSLPLSPEGKAWTVETHLPTALATGKGEAVGQKPQGPRVGGRPSVLRVPAAAEGKGLRAPQRAPSARPWPEKGHWR